MQQENVCALVLSVDCESSPCFSSGGSFEECLRKCRGQRAKTSTRAPQLGNLLVLHRPKTASSSVAPWRSGGAACACLLCRRRCCCRFAIDVVVSAVVAVAVTVAVSVAASSAHRDRGCRCRRRRADARFHRTSRRCHCRRRCRISPSLSP